MSGKSFGDLLADFIARLDEQSQPSWWECFYADCPAAAAVADRAGAILRDRQLSELTDDELDQLAPLIEEFDALADEYAAARGESVLPR